MEMQAVKLTELWTRGVLSLQPDHDRRGWYQDFTAQGHRARRQILEVLRVTADGRWFARHRQEWIAETIRVFGFINREHIERKFGISTPQASLDLQLFQAENPDAIRYNRSAKRYEANGGDNDGHA